MSNRLKSVRKSKKYNTNKKTFTSIEYPEIPKMSSDIYIITKYGDRLDNMAYDFYNDPQLWWIISRANPDKIKRDSFFIDPGLQIRIPHKNHIKNIYNSFNVLNNK